MLLGSVTTRGHLSVGVGQHRLGIEKRRRHRCDSRARRNTCGGLRRERPEIRARAAPLSLDLNGVHVGVEGASWRHGGDDGQGAGDWGPRRGAHQGVQPFQPRRSVVARDGLTRLVFGV